MHILIYLEINNALRTTAVMGPGGHHLTRYFYYSSGEIYNQGACRGSEKMRICVVKRLRKKKKVNEICINITRTLW